MFNCADQRTQDPICEVKQNMDFIDVIVIVEFPLPEAGCIPYGITIGPEKCLWFTEQEGNRIGRINLARELREYPLTTSNARPTQITVGAGRCQLVYRALRQQDWAGTS